MNTELLLQTLKECRDNIEELTIYARDCFEEKIDVEGQLKSYNSVIAKYETTKEKGLS